jgi:alkanesulfonate monooxygenase SsuD/methylene tetrahydromethanopterin reductase-like flavin-dependent oxidoreductase (luciferase family)
MTAVGLGIPEKFETRESIDFALSLEGSRIESVWFSEVARDSLVRISAVLTATQHLRVGTSVTLANRHPLTAAMTTAELHEFASGRFTYGVGAGPANHNEDLYGIPGAHPARRMSEYLRVLRGAWAASAAQPFTFRGEHFQIEHFSSPYLAGGGPPVVLAAVQQGMLRLAGRCADGVIFNPASTPWYCREYAFGHLEAGATAAGRTLADVGRIVCGRCAVAADRSVAHDWARRSIVEYGRYPVHQFVYQLHGFGQEAGEIVAAMGRDDLQAALNAVTDEMLETFAIAGTPDEARAALRRWDGLVDTVSLMPAAFEMSSDEIHANCEAIREAFY